MLLAPANRWQAFGLHLLISLAIFMVLGAIIYFWWYPGILFHYDGGLEGMKLIAGVDFFIGPLLTLLVYQVGKKTLKFDLGCIAVLQLVCIAGGVWTVWQTRPVAVVYNKGIFHSVAYQSFVDAGINPSRTEILQARWPVWVVVDESAIVPADASTMIPAIYSVGAYLPLAMAKERLAVSGRTEQQINALLPLFPGEVRPGGPSIRYYPAGFGVGAGLLALDITTLQPAGFVVHMSRKDSLIDRLRQTKVMLVQFIDRLMQ